LQLFQKKFVYLQNKHINMQNNNKFTGFYDDSNKPIFVGDRLKSKWDFEIIVKQYKDGDFYGKLVCEDNHSCKNIPYALNKGKGYNKIII
jgi:hypothetical protein